MRELVVISGKGGTGKTSLTASFAVLAGRCVIADCDVDASDLPILLAPEIRERKAFFSGNEAVIRPESCIGCGLCQDRCRFGAVTAPELGAAREAYRIDPVSCEGCGVCVRFCPVGAIDFPDRLCGEWMLSDTRCGTLVHAVLGTASENSGKLVSTVRREARRIAEEEHCGLILVDGPPGIGCPVIASVTGATQVLVVTEPTVSGEHDLERVLSLTRHFGIPTSVCVNRWDLNPTMTERIEEAVLRAGGRVAGRIRYDPSVTQAQIRAMTVVETDAPCAGDVGAVWDALESFGS